METFQIRQTALDILLVEQDKPHEATAGSYLAAALGGTEAAAPGPSHDRSAQKLALGYQVALVRANAKRMDSLAFQGVDSHICGCSVHEAAAAALGAVKEFVDENPNTSLRRILFMQYSHDAYDAFCEALKNIAATA